MEIIYCHRKLTIKYCHTQTSSFFLETASGEIIESLFIDAKNIIMNRVNTIIKRKQEIIKLKIYIRVHEIATKLLEKLLTPIKFNTDKVTFNLTNKQSKTKPINYYNIKCDVCQEIIRMNRYWNSFDEYYCSSECPGSLLSDTMANVISRNDYDKISYDFDIRNFEKIIYLFGHLIKHTPKLKVIQTCEHYNFFERVIEFTRGSNKLSVVSLVVDRQNSYRCESVKLNFDTNTKLKRIKCSEFDIITVVNLPHNLAQLDIIGSYGTIIDCETPISSTTLIAVTIDLRKSVRHNKRSCITDFLATDIKINKLCMCGKVSTNMITKVMKSLINKTSLRELCIRFLDKLGTVQIDHLLTILSNNNIKYFETTDISVLSSIKNIDICSQIKLLHTMVLTEYDVDLFMATINSMTSPTHVVVNLTIIMNNFESYNPLLIIKLFTWMQHNIQLQRINFCHNRYADLHLFWIFLDLCFKYLVDFDHINTINIHEKSYNSEKKMQSIYNLIKQNSRITKFSGCIIDEATTLLLEQNIKYFNDTLFKKTKAIAPQIQQ
jgi:hypothetical protein